ncbi:UNVERIFIED_CONTAM: protein NEDD1 [Sesamum latifolium]|uniref:Protein NEDD1 n=1 Tax=Sesamum latifolium TaxID=2727402 RepID=A0AAW2T9L0_9LAMI
MNSVESAKLLAASGDTVKLFDISVEPHDPCVLTYSPSPGLRVNSVKWNHNNLVLASAGEDSRISLWRKNGQSLWTVPAKNSRGEIIENKRCVKWLKGHTDTITGVMYNCKDEHIASVSRKGDLILHNLASGAKAAELRDPNGQVLGALDYSRMSRHLLVTAGDDGSIHLWDTTGRNPKASWLKQHSAPTSGVCFSPSNDKTIASVGLDMKLYTFDSGSRKPSSCIPYEAPFSSLAFTDDGLILAAGTSTGQVVFYDIRGKPQPITVLRAFGNSEAVTNLCWQRSKPATVNENNCTEETVLLAGDVGDSVLVPDPLPSRASLTMASVGSGSRNPSHFGTSGDLFSFPAGSTSSALDFPALKETPLRSSLLTGGTLARLHAPRSYNFKDDMEKDLDRRPSTSRRFGLSEESTNNNHPIFDWKSNSSLKQDDIPSTISQLATTPASTHTDDSSSITPPEAWGGLRLSDKLSHHRQSINMPSRFATLTSTSLSSGLMLSGLQDSVSPNQSTSSLTAGLSLVNLRSRDTPNQETSLRSPEAVSSPLGTKSITGQINLDNLIPALSLPRRFSSYAERIGATPSFSDASSLAVGSPKSKKTGAETREELLSSLLSRSEMPSAAGTSTLTTTMIPFMGYGFMLYCSLNAELGGATTQKTPLQPDLQQGTSFSLQLFQRTLEETLASFQNSIHEDMRNLHLEILRQFHMQEMEMSSVMSLILENQAEIMKTSFSSE